MMFYQNILDEIVDKSKMIFKGNLTEYCRNFLYPTPFELHFSNAHLQWFIDDPTAYIHKMNGTDKDLAAHFTIIKKYGVVLYGEEINDVFADVPEKDYVDSIWHDVEGAGEDILEEPVYVILNLCRVAAFLKNGLILSKKQGGEWKRGVTWEKKCGCRISLRSWDSARRRCRMCSTARQAWCRRKRLPGCAAP